MINSHSHIFQCNACTLTCTQAESMVDFFALSLVNLHDVKANAPISFEGGGDLTVKFFVTVGDLNIFFSGSEKFEPLNFPKFKFPRVWPGRGCFELIHTYIDSQHYTLLKSQC